MSHTPKHDAAVLIVNWNTRDLLAACLESVRREIDLSGLSVQVIVVDNASEDGSSVMVQSSFSDVTLLALADNLGFVGGNNCAYAVADARTILLLNPDTEMLPGSLGHLFAFLETHPEAGACGPLTLNADGTLQPSWTRFPTIWGEMWGRHDRRFRTGIAPKLCVDTLRCLKDTYRVDWISGACVLVRQSALAEDLGGVLFDPDFHMYSEETDLCYRLHRAAWPTYFVPQAEIIHHYGQSSKQAPARTLRLLYRSKLLFFRKHYGPVRAAQLKLGVGLAAAGKWAVFGVLSLLPTPKRAALAGLRARQWAVLQALA